MKRIKTSQILVIALLMLLVDTSRAELRIASIFSDHMVLQRDIPVAIWGTAGSGDAVTVRFSGQEKQAKAAPDGAWSIRLDPLRAAREGSDLVVSVGSQTMTLSDVVVGEVWLCAGQSNMAAPVSEFDESGEEAKAADYPGIRMIRVPERPAEAPVTTISAEWRRCTPQTASSMSMFAYHYARKLQRELDVPIGVVLCAWGGSSVPAWTSPQTLNDPTLRALVPYDVIGWRENCRPSQLYRGMLLPIAPYTVKGVVWYQGETEGDPEQNAFAYRHTFPAMIQDWRRLWSAQQDDLPQTYLPWYFVQLPRLIRRTQWAVVREGQAAALKLPNTAMMVTLDLGHETELHPNNKQQFAERMADLVLARSYAKQTPAEYPTIESVAMKEGKVRVGCAYADGLKTSDGQPPRCFEVAGADRVFAAAQATIERSNLTVWSDKVANPEALRYAFDGNPDVNVCNGAGLPLAPFRSDDWPVLTSELSAVDLAVKANLGEVATPAQILGADTLWKWTGRGVKPSDFEASRCVRPMASGAFELAVSNRLRAPLEVRSPSLTWRRAMQVDASVGVTLEITAQLHRATAPQGGLDLIASVAVGKEVRTYQITVAPMRLYGLQRNPQIDEIRTLGVNLDNGSRVCNYRMAIRPDGIAQVYCNGKVMGTLRPMVSPVDEAHRDSSVTFGKGMDRGEFTATVHRVAVDASGAFAPE